MGPVELPGRQLVRASSRQPCCTALTTSSPMIVSASSSRRPKPQDNRTSRVKWRAARADSGDAARTHEVTAGVSHQADGTGSSRGELKPGSDSAVPLTANSVALSVAFKLCASLLCCLIHCASARPNARSFECALCDSGAVRPRQSGATGPPRPASLRNRTQTGGKAGASPRGPRPLRETPDERAIQRDARYGAEPRQLVQEQTQQSER